jgi:hypothetical protein
MSYLTINAIRDRVWLSISPTTAAIGGLSFRELRLFSTGNFLPPEDALVRLANYFNIPKV